MAKALYKKNEIFFVRKENGNCRFAADAGNQFQAQVDVATDMAVPPMATMLHVPIDIKRGEENENAVEESIHYVCALQAAQHPNKTDCCLSRTNPFQEKTEPIKACNALPSRWENLPHFLQTRCNLDSHFPGPV